MSEIKSDKLSPRTASGTVVLGDSGDTFSVPAGVTIANSGTATGFGTVNTPAFGVKLSTGQSIVTNTWTKINFDSEIFDSDGNFDSTTNYRFTPTTAGTYYVICQSGYDLSQATIAATGIYLNGSSAAMKQGRHAGTVIWIGELNGSSDYIEGFTYQNQGSTQTSYSSVGNGWRTWMFGMRIA